jgi:O-succinylbenzoate synthase|tara:strand:- start:894 stop:1949 length:1056 start_codon:yes stop_codon:yes gene_type:complete
MKAYYFKHLLKFKTPGGTSRGILNDKESWFIVIVDGENYGIGECSLIAGLSPDSNLTFEFKLKQVCEKIQSGLNPSCDLEDYPSILFGLETALLSFQSSNPFVFSESKLTSGNDSISINGLIWMGEKSFMKKQIKDKIESGFNCIKIKIGALDFNLECELLSAIRSEYSDSDVEIRVDANGSFKPVSCLEKLERLSEYKIHSIEQPIKARQWHEMASLCEKSPLLIALDEELIGITDEKERKKLLYEINPAYIILKPSLIGGTKKADEWIHLAESLNIKWWSTSALESNIGLNAISQWVYNKAPFLKQGLGTGELFLNNIESPYFVEKGSLKYRFEKSWSTDLFESYTSSK